ncbi:LacI family DNA-binding transcriptional regulator [Nonomuraea sp. NPDC059194]|uniref:LacI family DNA-binding transcriptional regulator n=1 Tax=Nonomuraea sp. NPDC059194 TaxID=3346764 RepID=UPI00367CD6B1
MHDEPRPEGQADDRSGPTGTSTGPTIYEVAERAGVSIATVSRALRGTGPVSGRSREKVLKAVEELRFVPNRRGVSLAEGRHAANGVVFPALSGPYYAEVVLGYEEATSELGQSVIILSTDGRGDVESLVRDLAGRVDGMVIFGRTVPDETVAQLVASGLPVVLLARTPVEGADTLSAENTATAVRLTEHLLAHGHRRFALLGDDAGGDIAERWDGVRQALAGHGIVPDPPVPSEFSVEGAYEAAQALLKTSNRPDVIVCADDEMALGVLLAAEDAGLDVPGDIAVTGWDDIMAARHARPALTTVRQPMRELGRRAAAALDELVTGARTDRRHLILPTELVIRSSCGSHPLEDQ